MKDIQQLIKKNSQEGRYEDIFPKTFIDAVEDRESGNNLTEILSGFNMYFLSYNGSRELTRLQVPLSLRKTGLWITYVLYDKTVVTEWYAGEAIDDDSWKNLSNWRVGSNMLVGDISISSDGYWVVNGVVTTTKAQGEQGITPMLRVGSNNHLQVSYTNGSSWVDVSSNPVYTQFRVLNNKLQQSIDLGNTYTYISEELAYKFQESGNKLQMSKDLGNTWEDVSDYIAAWFKFTGTAGSSQADNVGKIQISRDNGVTWSDLSGEFTNSLYIKGYVTTVATLPSSAVQGDIYGVGPTYDPSDTEQTNPIYQLYVKDSTGWVNNGKFTSIAAGVVQTTGTSTTEVMSQDAVSKEFASVKQEISDAVKRFIFRKGNPISTSVNNRAAALNPMPIRRGDMVIIEDLDYTKYLLEIIVLTPDGETIVFDSPWLTDAWKHWRSSWNGLLTVAFKKPDDSDFSDSDIDELNSFSIHIVPKEVEMASAMPMIDTWENGRDSAIQTDELDFFNARTRTGLFAYKAEVGDIISFGTLISDGYDNISLIKYSMDDSLTRISSIVITYKEYEITERCYVRLAFGPKSGNTVITNEDITAFKNNISIKHAEERTFNDSASLRYINADFGNIDWNTGNPTSSTIRKVSEKVLLNHGDRIELDCFNPSSGSGTVINSMALYNKNALYLGNKDVSSKYYIHKGDTVYCRFTFSKDNNQEFAANELNNKVRLIRFEYKAERYNKILKDAYELGSISGADGSDTVLNSRIRTKDFIFVNGTASISLLNSADFDFGIVSYSKDKTMKQATNWGTNPVLVSNFNNEYYVRIIVKKKDNSDFTPSDIENVNEQIVISIVDDSVYDIALPQYYVDEIHSVINRINAKYTPNAFSYIVLTDTHDDDGAKNQHINEYFSRQLKAAVELSKKSNCLFIAHLGDLTTGSQGKENILNLANQITDITSQAKCPVFFVRGNHDDSTDVEPKNERTLADTITGKEFLVKAASAGNGELHTIDDFENNCAYYYDFLQQKIRVIVTDNMVSYPIEINSSGYLVYTGGQANWRGIHENQIKWLVNDALNVPDGYRIILLEHSMTHSKFNGSDDYGGLHGFDYFNAIKIAYNEKSSSLILAGSKQIDERREYLPEFDDNNTPIVYPSWITDTNFSYVKGKIVTESSGHQHSDTFWKDEAGIVQNNVGSAAYHMQWSHWEPPYGISNGVTSWEDVRTPESITEALMDVILVGKTKVNRIRFGAKAISDTMPNEYNI